MSESLSAGPGETFLMLTSGETDGGESCHAATANWPVERTAVLFVTFTGTPREQLADWQRGSSGSPAATAFVSAGAGPTDEDPEFAEDAFVSTVRHPSNLTRLGVEITRAIEYLERETGAQIVVCFRSLSALLQYADVNKTFQFLQVLHDRFAAADAIAHVHLDETAHDERTVATLRWAFDGVIE